MATVLDHLLESLNSRDSMVREDALRDASALPFRGKLQLFRMAAERYHQQRRRNRYRVWLSLAVCILALSLGPLAPHEAQGFVCSVVVVALCAVFLWTLSPEAARRQMTLLAQNIEDPHFVIPLLKLLYGPEQEQPDPILTDVLKRLLPKLRLRDAKRWRREEKALLLEPLNNLCAPDLAVCILKALEQVGDESAIPIVSRLASMQSCDPCIAQAARECLPFLLSNTQQLREAQTLLRASISTEQAPTTLLRPADATSGIEPSHELLRSVRSDLDR